MRHALRQPRRLFQPSHLAQKLVDVRQSLPADNALKADAPVVLLPQKAQQVDLVLVARRKVGVAALGGVGNVIAPVPDQKRLAQPGSRRDQRAVAHLPGIALAQGVNLVGVELGNAVSVRLQIIDKKDVIDLQIARQLAAVQRPGQVGQAQPPLAHRPRHAKTRRRHLLRNHKLLHDLFQPRILLGRELLDRARASGCHR